MTAKSSDPLEDIRGRKQDLLQQIAAAVGNEQKQSELQGELRELRKEKAGVVKELAESEG